MKYTFPENFWWGAATSGPQSEGRFNKKHELDKKEDFEKDNVFKISAVINWLFGGSLNENNFVYEVLSQYADFFSDFDLTKAEEMLQFFQIVHYSNI